MPEVPNERVTYFQGKVEDVEDLLPAFKNCDTVIHCAAALSPLGVTHRELYRANVDGTKNVILACISRGVRRLVYTSSTAAVLSRSEALNRVQTGSEDQNPYPEDATDFFEKYGYTKFLSEMFVLKVNHPGVLTTCVLRPSLIFGRGDGKLGDRLMNGLETHFLGDGNNVLDFVHVSDVAQAHLLCEQALRLPKSDDIAGRAFFVGSGRPTTVKEFFDWGHGAPKPIRIERALFFASVNLWMWNIFKYAPFGRWLTEDRITTYSSSWWFPVFSARQAFGYQPKNPLDAKRMMIEGEL